MKIRLFEVDSFTVKPFKGNPAAVCLLDQPREDAWMQALEVLEAMQAELEALS